MNRKSRKQRQRLVYSSSSSSSSQGINEDDAKGQTNLVLRDKQPTSLLFNSSKSVRACRACVSLLGNIAPAGRLFLSILLETVVPDLLLTIFWWRVQILISPVTLKELAMS